MRDETGFKPDIQCIDVVIATPSTCYDRFAPVPGSQLMQTFLRLGPKRPKVVLMVLPFYEFCRVQSFAVSNGSEFWVLPKIGWTAAGAVRLLERQIQPVGAGERFSNLARRIIALVRML